MAFDPRRASQDDIQQRLGRYRSEREGAGLRTDNTDENVLGDSTFLNWQEGTFARPNTTPDAGPAARGSSYGYEMPGAIGSSTTNISLNPGAAAAEPARAGGTAGLDARTMPAMPSLEGLQPSAGLGGLGLDALLAARLTATDTGTPSALRAALGQQLPPPQLYTLQSARHGGMGVIY